MVRATPALNPHRAPPLHLLAAEVPRAAWTLARLPFARRLLAGAARGDGRPVLLLPGLFNGDRSNAVMRRYLVRLGYDARGWGLGRNLGTATIGDDGERLRAAVAALADERGAPVTLVGVSLGGIMARLAAQRWTPLVRAVVTVSAPFAGHPRATNVWRAFQLATGRSVDDPRLAAMLAEGAAPLPVPTTAIWSASDGLVCGEACRAPDHAGAVAVAVRSGHMAVQFDPRVLRHVADAVAGPADR